MSIENDEFFERIHDHINYPRKESALIREFYRTISRNVLNGLGYSHSIQAVENALHGKDEPGIKKLMEEAGQNPDNFAQIEIAAAAKSIVCVPDQDAATSLLRTAISGIPLKSEGKKDTITEFTLAAPSNISTMNKINPFGQSRTTLKPNKEGAEKLLKAVLKETGFAATNAKFSIVKNALARSRKNSRAIKIFDWTHPENNNLSISVEESQIKNPKKPLDWAYRVKITHTKA